MAMLFRLVFPVFVSVMACEELVVPGCCGGNERLVGTNWTAVPEPVKFKIAVGLPGTLSLIVMAAVRVPVLPGVNVTVMVQVAPGASVEGDSGQLLVWAKFEAFVPPKVILVIVSGAKPELVKESVIAALVVPTNVLGKVRPGDPRGVRVRPGCVPVPVAGNDWEPLGMLAETCT